MKNETLENIVREPAATAYRVTNTPLDLISLTRTGIRKQALLKLGKKLGLSLKELAQLLPITERTIQRKKSKSLLSPAISEQIILISETTDKGIEVFGNIEIFKKWLREENTALGGYMPLHLLDTTIGIQWVEDELCKLSRGVYS